MIRLTEWEVHTEHGLSLTDEDRSIFNALEEVHDQRIELDELLHGLRVRTRSWVGVVRLETVEFRVVPKLAGDRVALARMIEFACGLDGLRRLPRTTSVDVDGESLLELVALLFVEETRRLLRRGVVKHYVPREEDLGVVRGRILADRQVLERFGQLDRILCHYDELESDVDENRLLLAGLRAVSRGLGSGALRRSLERLRSVLEPECDLSSFDLRRVRRELIYDRLNAHYEAAHRLAWLLLDGMGIEDLVARGRTRSICFLLDMNALFERFVEQVFRRTLEPCGFAVESQHSLKSVLWDVRRSASFGSIRPDLVVTARCAERPLAVDAKYKEYDERGLSPSDLYQLLLYASATSSGSSDTEQSVPTALLVYPTTVEDDRDVVLEARRQDGRATARVRSLAISIPDVISELDDGIAGPECNRIAQYVTAYLASAGLAGIRVRTRSQGTS